MASNVFLVRVPSGTTTAKTQELTVLGALKANMRDYGLLLALILIMLFFQYFTAGVLFKPVNLTNIILQNSYIIVMALGMLLVIVAVTLIIGGPNLAHRILRVRKMFPRIRRK